MKKAEIKVGDLYTAKVGGRLTTVRVDAVREISPSPTQYARGVRVIGTHYDVTNLATGRRTIFSSAAKFRGPTPTLVTVPEPLGTNFLAAEIPEPQAEVPCPDPPTSEPPTDGPAACSGCESTDPMDSDPAHPGGLSLLPETDPCETPETGGGGPPTPTTPESPATPPEAPRKDPADAPAAPSPDSCGPPTSGEGATCPPPQGRLGSLLGRRLQLSADFDLHSSDSSRMVVADEPTTTGEPEMTTATATAAKPLTAEQADILATAPSADVLVIGAGAGTGKTFTLSKLAASLPGRGQYTAFNTSLVKESAAKFPASCSANTSHSLAFRAEGRRFAKRLGGRRVRSSEVARMLDIADVNIVGPDGKDKRLAASMLASHVMAAVKRFCQSADREVTERHFPKLAGVDAAGCHDNANAIRGQLLPKARQAWADLSNPDGQLPFSHDVYVKTWQLNKPVISANYILLDEYQDTAPVLLDVLQQQVARGTKLILVGDDNQRIYEWRGAVNAGDAFPDAPRRYLSQSFRFGQAIAEVANAVLKHMEEKSPLVMKGTPGIRSEVKRVENPTCILCRTNAGAVGHFLKAAAEGRRPFLVGGGADVISFVEAALDLQQGRATAHPELACFTSWTEVVAYAQMDEGEDLRLMVKLITDFTAEAILDGLRNMPVETQADLVLSTAHRSKGREWDTVKLASDFPALDKSDDSALRLLYVACTRAKLYLDVSECPPFCGGQDRDGNELPTIDISKARRIKHDAAADDTVVDLPTPVATPEPARKTSNHETKQHNGQAPTECTWAKWDDRWCVRGAKGLSGTVEVVRRNGTKSKTRIGKPVWENGVAAIYEVA